MRSRGVKNVQYPWHDSSSPVDDLLDQCGEDIRDWYPGDGYVDWDGASWFLGIEDKPLLETAADVPTQRAVTYINTYWDSQSRWGEPWNEDYWGNSRLQGNAIIAKKFSTAIADRRRP